MFPARAGMSRLNITFIRNPQGVPRASGDEPDNVPATTPKTHVFPARAGMSLALQGQPLGESRVPRASGDEPGATADDWSLYTCSPRERG